MPRTLSPVRLMNADVAGGFQLLFRDRAAEAFRLLPDLMEYLSSYRNQNIARCRLAVDWITAAVPGEMDLEIRHGLHVRIAAPENVRAASLSRQCDSLTDELCRWFDARDVQAIIPEAAEDGTVALIPGPEKMQFLSKERLVTQRADSELAYYYGSLENAGGLDTAAIAECLRKMGNGGIVLQLFELDGWQIPQQRLEMQLEKLLDVHARAAVESMAGAAVRYGFNLIVWGGTSRNSSTAASEICRLMQSDGIYLRCPGVNITRLPQYYQAVYDVWSLHGHVGGFIGNGGRDDLNCMANVVTADELRAVCGSAEDELIDEAILQAAVDAAAEQFSDVIGKVLDKIDELLGGEIELPEYPVAHDAPYQEAPDEIKQYLAQIVERMNDIPSRAEVAELSEGVQELRGHMNRMDEQNRRMEAKFDAAREEDRQRMDSLESGMSELRESLAAVLNELKTVKESGLSAQESLKIILQQVEKKGRTAFHPEQLRMMGYSSEEELNDDLKKRSMTGEEIRELRCVASLCWEGTHDNEADFEVYGWALGCFYEKFVMETFGKLYQKEKEARNAALRVMFPNEPVEYNKQSAQYKAWKNELAKSDDRIDLAALDGLSGKAWQQENNNRDKWNLWWGHLDYWRLNFYATQITAGVGQKLSGAEARAFWNSWFMIMNCMRRFRNSFVHSNENGKSATVTKEILQASHNLLLCKGNQSKKPALSCFAVLPEESNYQFKFLDPDRQISDTHHEQLSGSMNAYKSGIGERLYGYSWGKPAAEALLNEMDAHTADDRYTDSLLTFLLKCKNA